MKKIFIILSYILFFFNNNLLSVENNKLKIGLLAPFSGEFKDLGNSILFSLQLALDEIDDKDIIIIPRDSGSNNKEKLNKSIQEIANEGVKIIIGPIEQKNFDEVKKYKDLIFISPSNIQPNIQDNIISIGISLESQLISLEKFLKKQNKNKTVILYPKNEYMELVDSKINKMDFKYYKKFKYSTDPKIITGEIEKLTNYSQRKNNLEIRKKILEKRDDYKAKTELKLLEERYTLGKVNFDSVIVIDFGNSLKSALTSLIFSDVDQNEVLFTTVNQWFDKSIFFENSVKTLFYPSVDFNNFEKYNDKYIKTFNIYPSEITILTYDALGLIYYIWKKKNKNIVSVKDFFFEGKIKGKIGTFTISGGKIIQDLKIYKVSDNKFTKF